MLSHPSREQMQTVTVAPPSDKTSRPDRVDQRGSPADQFFDGGRIDGVLVNPDRPSTELVGAFPADS
jgi:hypothetical protein